MNTYNQESSEKTPYLNDETRAEATRNPNLEKNDDELPPPCDRGGVGGAPNPTPTRLAERRKRVFNWEQRFKRSEHDLNKLGFTVKTDVKITKKTLQHIAGFVEGEGSLNVQITTCSNLRFGIEIDPEFGLYQHNRNCQHLFTLCRHFKAGSISIGGPKKNIENQFEKASYRVFGKVELLEKVVPYLKSYVLPFAGPYLQGRYKLWEKVVILYNERAHLVAARFYSEIIPLAVGLRSITPRSDARNDLTTVESCRKFVVNIMTEKLAKKGQSCSGLTDLQICELFDKYNPTRKGVPPT